MVLINKNLTLKSAVFSKQQQKKSLSTENHGTSKLSSSNQLLPIKEITWHTSQFWQGAKNIQSRKRWKVGRLHLYEEGGTFKCRFLSQQWNIRQRTS